MLKNKVTVVENDITLVGTRLIGGPSILVGIRVFELGRLGGSSDTPMKLGFKPAGETKADLEKELDGKFHLLEEVYAKHMEPHMHTMLFKWYPAERVTYVDCIQSLEDILTELVNEVQ